MSNKLIYVVSMAVLFVGLFALLATIVHAKSSNMLSSKKQNMVVILKNDANIDVSKDVISKISQVKIIKIQDRNKEWSKMVNKMDLPKMENPFKNEFVVKIKKNANRDEIYNKIKEMDFVEDVECFSEPESAENQNKK